MKTLIAKIVCATSCLCLLAGVSDAKVLTRVDKPGPKGKAALFETIQLPGGMNKVYTPKATGSVTIYTTHQPRRLANGRFNKPTLRATFSITKVQQSTNGQLYDPPMQGLVRGPVLSTKIRRSVKLTDPVKAVSLVLGK